MEILRIEPKKRPPRKQRVCAYCRVSTLNEEQQSSIENQISYYRDMITSKPEYIFVDVFYDHGKSGRTDNRPGFQKMLKAAREGKIDLIITKSVSRFARDTDTMLRVVRELREQGIGVFFELQKIITLNLEGELLITVYAAFAQAEVENTSSLLEMSHLRRTQDGNHRASLAGLFGYSKNADGTTVPDENAKWVLTMYQMAASGFTITQIATTLNSKGVKTKRGKRFSRQTVEKILRNPAYCGIIVRPGFCRTEEGEICRNDGTKAPLVVEDYHQGIVSEALWMQAQEKLAIHQLKQQQNNRVIFRAERRR